MPLLLTRRYHRWDRLHL